MKLLFLLFLVPVLLWGNDPVPMFLYNPSHNSRTSIELYKEIEEVNRPINVDSDVDYVSVADNGILYFLSRSKMYCANRRAEILWSKSIGNYGINNNPLILENGNVVFATWGDIFCFTNNGDSVWRFSYAGECHSGITLNLNNRLVFGAAMGSSPRYLYCLNASTGQEIWKYLASNEILSTPATDEVGNIIFGTLDGYTYKLTPQGTLSWRVNIGGLLWSSPLIEVGTGNIYEGSDSGRMTALDKDGNIRWRYSTGDLVRAHPNFNFDKTGVIFGSRDGYFRCVDKDTGELKWSYYTGGLIEGGSVIEANGDIFFTDFNGYLHRLDKDGNKKSSYKISSTVSITVPAVDSNQYMYLGARSGTLIIFRFYDPTDISSYKISVPEYKTTSITPNPLRDKGRLKFNSKTTGNGNLYFYDLKGRKRVTNSFTVNKKGDNTIFFKTKLTEGIYFWEATVNNEKIGSGKITVIY
ncbi:MAG: PQQ-binding-like beta-propeller repeat protein [Candidatus Coatesbacteria bacterium]|nr:PQQ-binding-like beta-propeller repeat protein [Candidatus Coatesbacteria bacterium]